MTQQIIKSGAVLMTMFALLFFGAGLALGIATSAATPHPVECPTECPVPSWRTSTEPGLIVSELSNGVVCYGVQGNTAAFCDKKYTEQ